MMQRLKREANVCLGERAETRPLEKDLVDPSKWDCSFGFIVTPW